MRALLKHIAALVSSGDLAGVGSETVARFEEGVAAAWKRRHCVATVSGTQALELALEALGVGLGDEVIVPALAAFGTYAAVVRRGATPVVVDVVADGVTLDPAAAAAACSDGTRAVITVHVLGIAPEPPRLDGIFIVDDAAQSLPGQLPDSDIATLSFASRKAIDLGEGGALLTDDATLAARLRSLICLGHSGVSLDGRAVELSAGHRAIAGTSARLPGLQAALGYARLGTLASRLAAANAASQQRATDLRAERREVIAATPFGVLSLRSQTSPRPGPLPVYRAHREPALVGRVRLTATPHADAIAGRLAVDD